VVVGFDAVSVVPVMIVVVVVAPIVMAIIGP
jgi:hypothetical protein